MSNADSCSLGLVGASFMAASWPLCSVLNADASFHNLVGAPFMAAYVFPPMATAEPALLGSFGTSLFTTYFSNFLRPVLDAYSPFDGLVGASFVVGSFSLCTMPIANPFLNDLIGASLVTII